MYDVKKAMIRSVLGRFRAAHTSAATRPTLHLGLTLGARGVTGTVQYV